MAQYDINLSEYLRILKKRKFTVIFIAAIMGIFSTVFAAMNAPIPLYTSTCSIKFEKETTVEGLYAKTMSWSEGDDMETQLSVLKSYPVLKRVGEELGMIADNTSTEGNQLNPHVAAVIDGLRSKIEVSREGYANIIAIQATDRDPALAQKLANTVALAYMEVHTREQSKRTTEAVKYISEELTKVRQKLRGSENEFNKFTQKNQLVSIDLQGENLLLVSKETKGALQKLEESKEQLDILVTKLDQFLKNPSGAGDTLYSEHANKQYEMMNEALIGILVERDSLLKDYTAKHPEVIAIQRKIIKTVSKMRIITLLQMKNIDRKRATLEARLEEVNGKTHDLMEKKLEYNRLKRKVVSFNDMTVLLEKKNQEALISKAEKPDEVTIVRPALFPRVPINPPKTASKGAMGLVIGLVIGLVVAFVVETFDTSLGAIDDVEEALGSQVLGMIPHGDFVSINERPKGGGPGNGDTSHFKQEAYLVSHFLPETMIAESFRALRTNITFSDMEKKIKVMSVTATSPSEGKSMVSTNLAITMAQAGMKTLLVECDMRKPVIYKAFGVDRNPGLTDVLLGNYSVDEVTKTITDIMVGEMSMDEVMATAGLDNLNLLTCGTIPPNPSELIDSQRLVELIDEVKNEYDIVLFDTPPILSTSDPIILGTKVDAVLLVYRVGAVSRTLLKRSATQLEQVKATLLGVVLNDIKSELSPDFHGYKYYKSYYSYKDAKEEKKGWKRVLSIFDETRKKITSNFSKTRENVTSKKVEPSVHTKQRSKERDVVKNRGSLKLWVSLIALVSLAVGVLVQNGFLQTEKNLFAKQPVMKDTRPVLPQEKVSQPIKMAISTPPPPKEIPKTKELPAATKPIRYPYSLRTGSFRTLGQAKKEIDLLKKNGLWAYWNYVDLGKKGKWYRIFVGSFATSEQAEEVKKKYSLSSATVSKTPYAVEIGEFPSKEALNEKMAMLSKAVYSPYVIETPNKGYRLLVGSFVSQERADQVANELNTLGLNCKAVLR